MLSRFLYTTFFGLLLTGLNAQQADSAVTAIVQRFFDGLNATDTVVIKSTLSENARMETVIGGVEEVKEEPIERFLVSLAKDKSMHLEEEVLSLEVRSEEEIATVWAPYRLYLNGQLTHCGVNVFTLINTVGSWKIYNVLDTRRKENCLPEE